MRRRRRKWPWIALAIIAALVVILGVVGANDPMTQAVIQCEDFVKTRLKAPASAEFSGARTTHEGDQYTVRGAVDSQNGFGALIRNTYHCVVRDEGSTWRLINLTFSGR